MAVTREQFESGLTYQGFKDKMTRNREQLEQNEKDLELKPEDLQAFRGIPKALNVLALAEDWCGDVVANLPILGRLAEESGKLNVRVHLRDQEPGSQIMDQYLNRGEFKSIPTYIFLDENFKELGVWIERPDSVTKLREEKRQDLYKQNPDWGDPSKPIAELPEDVRTRVQQASGAMRNETKPFANSEVVRELRELVERVSSKLPV
jgi:thioredoxin family protein